jgi:hypothetical protein
MWKGQDWNHLKYLLKGVKQDGTMSPRQASRPIFLLKEQLPEAVSMSNILFAKQKKELFV